MRAGDEETELRLMEIRQLIRNHARAKHDRVRLEQFRKVMKARLMKDAEKAGYQSIGAQEREAYADPEYEVCINGLAVASEQEAEAWWLLQVEEWKFDAWRTRMASERAEKARYG